MKISTLSIVVGNAACNAACPFCVSKMTGQTSDVEVNWDRFDIAVRLAERGGANTVLLTGKGEPTLWPDLILAYLEELSSRDLPLKELQTNGILLERNKVLQWRNNGLTLVCLSITHFNAAINRDLMRIEGDYDYWDRVKLLHDVGLSVRLNCTLLRDGIWDFEDVEYLIDKCHKHGVEQLTLRDVAAPTRSNNQLVSQYVAGQRLPAAGYLRGCLEMHGAVPVLRLPHGATIYDYAGQNVCLNNCLTTDPDTIRQLIFYPDGRITYDWTYEGARIL